eukprot:4112155-Prymnesium_polylepis.2
MSSFGGSSSRSSADLLWPSIQAREACRPPLSLIGEAPLPQRKGRGRYRLSRRVVRGGVCRHNSNTSTRSTRMATTGHAGRHGTPSGQTGTYPQV